MDDHVRTSRNHDKRIEIDVIDDDSESDPIATDAFEPTHHAPGSPEKIEVLIQRLEARQPLWHPLDRQQFDRLQAAYDIRILEW